ncbi:MAG TPA: ABC transporter ATP-binding protein [Bacilli bacterium]|nr:ABC transporter ATP-binding protein [Bacilli bacterium]
MKSVKLLFNWTNKYWLRVTVILLLTIFFPITYSYVPLFTKYVIDLIDPTVTGEITTNLPRFLVNIFERGETVVQTILYLGITLVIYQLIRAMLMFYNGYSKGVLSENISRDMRVTLYDHIQDLSYSYHNNVDTGDLIQRCTSDIDTTRGFVSAQLPEILHIIAMVGASLYQMFSINVTLTFYSMIIVPLTFTASLVYYRYVRKTFPKIEESEAKMTTVIQENLAGVRVVKAFANEKYELDKFTKQNEDFANRNLKFNSAIALYWGASDAITVLQYVITMSIAIYLSQSVTVSSSDIIAIMMLLGSFIWPIRGLGRIIGEFGKTLVAVERIDEILKQPSEFNNDGTLTPDIKGDIEFKDVHFKFDDTDSHLLNGVTFSIKAGETVAFIGRTGSGKSTIANILTRLLEYTKGSITIDGVELKEISKRHLRKKIGMVLQDPFLFSKTVYDNIAIANKGIEKDKVYQAAKVAAMEKDIMQFDKGYDTLVGEKGTTLSGGQKQRMAIARILVDEKPVIIFDDSLSAVDSETDLAIRRSLKDKTSGITTIIITHRITTAKEADKIIVLENGIVTDIGTHKTLAKKDGLYAKLWKIQGQLESEFLKILDQGGEA